MQKSISRALLLEFLALCSTVCLAAESDEGPDLDRVTVQRCKAATALVDLGTRGSGSGFLIHRSGIFVTNRHVVSSVPAGEPVKLVLHSGEDAERVVESRVAFVSEDDDLALLKTDEKITEEPLKFKDAKDARLAELSRIIVLGYPFGRRLAADGRDYPTISINTGRVSRLEKVEKRLEKIQFDAATNPGNSGGPMITADGSVVGVVVSGVRGASLNFAIPAKRVMALVEKPVIVLYPTEISFSARDSRQDFEIELLPTAPLPEKAEVTLHLGEPGAKRRSFPASGKDGRFVVDAGLLKESEDSAPLRLRIEAKLPDATITTNVDDGPVKVGDRELQLSDIRAVMVENGATKTVLTAPNAERTRYESIDGSPTGLPVLQSERFGLKLGLDGLKDLKVSSYGAAPMEVPFEIEVKGAGGAEFNRRGALRFMHPPANLSGRTRAAKKDAFESMFGNMRGRANRNPTLDLLSLSDLGEDTLAGNWKLNDKTGDVSSADEAVSWLGMPVRSTGDFRLTVEVIPTENEAGTLRIHVPIGDAHAVLSFDGGKEGRAMVENDSAREEDDEVEMPSFRKGIPFRVDVMVSGGNPGPELTVRMTVTEKRGNMTSSMPLPKALKLAGDIGDLRKPDSCPVKSGRLGIGVSGQPMRITTVDMVAPDGHLLVSRDLAPGIKHHPSKSAVHWPLDEPGPRNMVRGREYSPDRAEIDRAFEGFGGRFGGGMSYAGSALGEPDIGAAPRVEGAGAMRVEGDRAGFQFPAHPRLWKPSFTVAFWFMADDIDPAKGRRHLLDDGGRRTGMSVYLIGDTLRAGAWDDTAETPDGKWEGTWLKAPGIKAGEWCHVAVVLDADAEEKGSAMRLFVNGTKVDEGFGMALNSQRESAAIGTINGSSRPGPDDPEDAGRSQFVGMIDAVSVYRSALDEDSMKVIVGGRFGLEGTRFPELPAVELKKPAPKR